MEENKNVEVVAENAAVAETKTEAKPETRRGNKPQKDGKRRPQRQLNVYQRLLKVEEVCVSLL